MVGARHDVGIVGFESGIGRDLQLFLPHIVGRGDAFDVPVEIDALREVEVVRVQDGVVVPRPRHAAAGIRIAEAEVQAVLRRGVERDAQVGAADPPGNGAAAQGVLSGGGADVVDELDVLAVAVDGRVRAFDIGFVFVIFVSAGRGLRPSAGRER